MDFFFCNDNIERCVKGTKRKWVLSKLDISTIWHVKKGTGLSQQEILAFEAIEFCLPQRKVISPRRLFGAETSIHMVLTYPIPLSPERSP